MSTHLKLKFFIMILVIIPQRPKNKQVIMNMLYQTFIEGCSTRSLRDNKSAGHLCQSPFVITKYDRIAECRSKINVDLAT